MEKEVTKRGGSVESAAGEGNGTDPSDILMRRIVDAFSEYERLLIRARTKAALTAMRQRGQRTGRHEPFGYQFGPDGRTMIPILDEQAAIERMLTWRRDGHSYAKIARQLDAAGVKPKRTATWQPDSVRRICQRSMMAGTLRQRDHRRQ